MIVKSFKYAKKYQIVHFNMVNFILYKFHVNSKIEKESIQEGRINAIRPLDWACGSEVKASASNAGDLGSIPGSGRSPGEGNGNPLQHSCLENPMDGEAW